jgi:hypothetical protein
LAPLSYCHHVVVEWQCSHLTIKNYHWLLLVSSPKTTSRKTLASGFFLNFWHSHLYNQTPSSHRIHQSIARVIVLSTNPTTNLLVLYYSNIKKWVQLVKLGWLQQLLEVLRRWKIKGFVGGTTPWDPYTTMPRTMSDQPLRPRSFLLHPQQWSQI